MVREAIRYQDAKGRDFHSAESASQSDMAAALSAKIVLSPGMAEQIAFVMIENLGTFLPILTDLQAYQQREKGD